MLLEKSVIDHMKIKDVYDTDVLVYDINAFDIGSATEKLVQTHKKFLLIHTDKECIILSSYDLLALHLNGDIHHMKKWHKALSGHVLLKDYLEGVDEYRYSAVYTQDGYGIVDKQKIKDMYQQLDEENSALITSILDNIHMAICIIDVNCRVKFWNKSAEKLYEISREKIYNEVLTDYFPTALLPTVLKNEEQVIDVYNLPREDCHNLISASPLYKDGQLIGAISYDKDITDQIKIEEDLKETESNLEVLQKELQAMGQEVHTFDTMVGQDPSWLEVIKLTKMVSKSMLNILISGESGTGKEVLARAVHHESDRLGHFVPLNCSAIPKDLFESELFGYESGAFSGASASGKIGRFEFANGGTLFLDEIGDMPLDMQAKLLRVLEDGQVTPVGSNKSLSVDVRVISASNKDLLSLCNQDLFRKDLYYRLNGIGVHLTALRERPGDIELIALKFLDDFKAIYGIKSLTMPSHIMAMLKQYHWEGNIRELKNIIERTVILSKNNGLNEIADNALPDVIRNMAIKMKVGPSYSLNDLIEKTEKEAILEALSQSTSKAMAAKILKIPRSTLYFKMDKYKIGDTSES